MGLTSAMNTGASGLRSSQVMLEIIGDNIANINTPSYRMRDLPVDAFREALKRAVEQQRESVAQSSSSSAAGPIVQTPVEDFFPGWLFEAVQAPAKNITFQDANNRSIETQLMELTKNSMMQNFVIELMRTQFSMLQNAISERV